MTLLGPGGVGKTRLAFAAGRRAAMVFADGALAQCSLLLVLDNVEHLLDGAGLLAERSPARPPRLPLARLSARCWRWSISYCSDAPPAVASRHSRSCSGTGPSN